MPNQNGSVAEELGGARRRNVYDYISILNVVIAMRTSLFIGIHVPTINH